MRLLLIDGSNLYESARHMQMKIDYKKMLHFFNEDEQLLRAYYFTALRDKSIEAPIRKTVDWLKHNGYVCVTKETKEFQTSRNVWNQKEQRQEIITETKVKGNVDVDIATYAFVHAARVREIVLFSGDGDFTVMVKELQTHFALKVFVVSSMGTVSTELRAQADKYIDLVDIREDIEMEICS